MTKRASGPTSIAWPFQRGALTHEYLADSSHRLDAGLGALGGGAQLEVRHGLPLVGVQAFLLVAVLVPGVRDVLLDLVELVEVDVVHLVQVAVDDRAARHHQVLGAVVVRRLRHVAVGHQVLRRQAAADARPVLVEPGDREQVGDVDLVDEVDRAVDDRADQVQPLHVDRADRARRVQVDRRGRAAHQPVRVRVAAAEDRLDLDDLLLEVERLEVVRDRHQVRFGRQLVRRVAPVAVAERAELPRLDELLQAVLQVAEIARARTSATGRSTARAARWRPGPRSSALTTSTQSRACRW